MGGDKLTALSAGLPNLVGHVNSGGIGYSGDPFNCDGVFVNNGASDTAMSGGVIVRGYKILFDASKSNAIYGNSNTVQPPTITLIPQIKY